MDPTKEPAVPISEARRIWTSLLEVIDGLRDDSFTKGDALDYVAAKIEEYVATLDESAREHGFYPPPRGDGKK